VDVIDGTVLLEFQFCCDSVCCSFDGANIYGSSADGSRTSWDARTECPVDPPFQLDDCGKRGYSSLSVTSPAIILM
jgi:hypothetical protein